MKKNIIFIIVFSLLSAVFATLYLYDSGQQNKSMSEPVKVVVAAEKIEQGKIITSSMIKEITVPKQYAQPKCVSDRKEFFVDNKPYFVSTTFFEEGEQITSTKIVPIYFAAGISTVIPDDKRAITLVFDNKEIRGIVSAGSKIDLISVGEYENKSQNVEEAACVIAQNLLVLSVGKNIIGSVTSYENDTETSVSMSIPVSVSVSMEEAQKILLAREKGVLKIALRPLSDETIQHNKIIKINDIYENAVTDHKIKDNNKHSSQYFKKKQQEVNEIINKYYQQQ